MSVGPGSPVPHGPADRGRALLRVTNADRDTVVELLQQAYAEGRLTRDEHEGRVGRALTAATYQDLDALLTDIPGGRPRYPGMSRPASQRANPLAIASLAFGVAQFAGLWLLAGIPAIVLGHRARRQIRRTGEQGAGMALTGLLLGWADVAATALLVAAVIVAGAVLASHHGG